MAKMSLSRSFSTGGKKTQTRSPIRSNAKKPRTASAPVVRSRPSPDGGSYAGKRPLKAPSPAKAPLKAPTTKTPLQSSNANVAAIKGAASRALTANNAKTALQPVSGMKGSSYAVPQLSNTAIPSIPKGTPSTNPGGEGMGNYNNSPATGGIVRPAPVAAIPEVTAPTAPRPVAPTPTVTAPGSGVGTGGGQFSTVGRSGIVNGPFGLLQRMRQSRGPITGPSITPELLRRIAARQFSR